MEKTVDFIETLSVEDHFYVKQGLQENYKIQTIKKPKISENIEIH